MTKTSVKHSQLAAFDTAPDCCEILNEVCSCEGVRLWSYETDNIFSLFIRLHKTPNILELVKTSHTSSASITGRDLNVLGQQFSTCG